MLEEMPPVAARVAYHVMRAANDDIYPDGWHESRMIALPKESPPSALPEKNRPLAIGNAEGKLLDTIVTEAVTQQVAKELNDVMYGFRASRSVEDVAFVLLNATQIRKLQLLNTYVMVLDVEKAYDNVDHQILLMQMRKMSISEVTIARVQRILANTKYVVNGRTMVNPSKGLPQGSPISPVLFNVYIHDMAETVQSVMRCDSGAVEIPALTDAEGKHIEAKTLAVLNFADDITGIAATEAGVQRLHSAIDAYLRGVRLRINPTKTKVVEVWGGTGRQCPLGRAVNWEVVQSCRVLGFWISQDSLAESRRRRITKTRNTSFALQNQGAFNPRINLAQRKLLVQGALWGQASFGEGVIGSHEEPELQKIAEKVARQIIQAPQSCNGAKACLSVGWHSMQARGMLARFKRYCKYAQQDARVSITAHVMEWMWTQASAELRQQQCTRNGRGSAMFEAYFGQVPSLWLGVVRQDLIKMGVSYWWNRNGIKHWLKNEAKPVETFQDRIFAVDAADMKRRCDARFVALLQDNQTFQRRKFADIRVLFRVDRMVNDAFPASKHCLACGIMGQQSSYHVIMQCPRYSVKRYEICKRVRAQVNRRDRCSLPESPRDPEWYNIFLGVLMARARTRRVVLDKTGVFLQYIRTDYLRRRWANAN